MYKNVLNYQYVCMRCEKSKMDLRHLRSISCAVMPVIAYDPNACRDLYVDVSSLSHCRTFVALQAICAHLVKNTLNFLQSCILSPARRAQPSSIPSTSQVRSMHLFYLYAFMVPYKLFFKHGPSWMLMSWFLTIPYYGKLDI